MTMIRCCAGPLRGEGTEASRIYQLRQLRPARGKELSWSSIGELTEAYPLRGKEATRLCMKRKESGKRQSFR